MRLVVQAITGVAVAGLAESLALADGSRIQQRAVMAVLELIGLACPVLVNTGRAIVEGESSTTVKPPLQNMHEDLNMGLVIGN
jgi:3-hydroxyisobutyrate dehydrogenase-like beta-hydroxyacid dehydrogenase